jgi:hypothetical protein
LNKTKVGIINYQRNQLNWLATHPPSLVRQFTHIGGRHQHVCYIEGLFVHPYLEPHI